MSQVRFGPPTVNSKEWLNQAARPASHKKTFFDESKEIPRRFPDIDLALLHLGGTMFFGLLMVTVDPTVIIAGSNGGCPRSRM
jgi:hypothetical protein